MHAPTAPVIALLSDLALKSTLLLLLAGLLALTLRRASAAARHLHWQLTLAGLLALPLLGPALPALHVPVPQSLAAAAPWLAAPAAPVARTRVGAPEAAGRAAAIVRPGLAIARNTSHEGEAALSGGAPSGAAGGLGRRGGRAIEAAPVLSTPLGSAWKAGPDAWLTGVWAAGAALVLTMLAVGLLRAAALARAARPLDDAGWNALAERVRRELGLRRRVRLLIAAGPVVPMTWGLLSPVVLLPGDARDWSPPRRRHVLLHELAHVQRGDWLTQLLAQVVCALYWFQPLAWLTARALRRERERACDDHVLLAGGKASEYAGHLLDIARTRSVGLAGNVAALAMARRSQLEGRLLAVLDEGRDRRQPASRRAALAGLLAAAIVVPLACMQPQAEPAPQESPAPSTAPRDAVEARVVRERPIVIEVPLTVSPTIAPPAVAVSPETSLDVSAIVSSLATLRDPAELGITFGRDGDEFHFEWGGCDDEENHWSWPGPDGQYSVHSEGWLRVTDDDRGIAEIDEDAALTLEVKSGSGLTRIEVLRGQDGEPRLLGRLKDENAGEPELRAALAEMLLPVLRQTGLGADDRIERIVDREGVPGVLAEIGRLTGDSARLCYSRLLIEEHDLTPAELAQLLVLAARDLDSDSAMQELLLDDPARWLGDPALQEPLLAALATLDSDAHAAEVLEDLLDAEELQPGAAAALLSAAAQGIESDPYITEVLHQVNTVMLREPPVAQAFFEAAGTVESDAYQTEALAGLLEREGLTDALRVAALQSAAAGIESDAYMAELLEGLQAQALAAPAARAPFFAALATISSDAYGAEVVSGRLEEDADSALVIALLDAAASGIESDAYMAEVLGAVPPGLLREPEVRAAFLKAADNVESRAYREEVLALLPDAAEGV